MNTLKGSIFKVLYDKDIYGKSEKNGARLRLKLDDKNTNS